MLRLFFCNFHYPASIAKGCQAMNYLLRASLAVLALAVLQGCAVPVVTGGPAVLFSPYKHINITVDPAAPIARSMLDGKLVPIWTLADAKSPTALSAVSLAFASGECGEEHWGALNADLVAQANVAAMAARGLKYMISTGGEGNVFTCHTDAGMEKFISRYASPALLGVDFDIESTQTPAHIRELVQRVKVAQVQWPDLRCSFTLATLAASDGAATSLNATGSLVMQALKEADVHGYFINLMVMDFGPAAPANCVVRAGRCDMAASARQAVTSLHSKFGVPLAQIELTAMIGVNDVEENVFTLDDASALAQFVRSYKLAGLHYWSLDRDKPCASSATAVSPACSSLNQIPELAYLQSFSSGLR